MSKTKSKSLKQIASQFSKEMWEVVDFVDMVLKAPNWPSSERKRNRYLKILVELVYCRIVDRYLIHLSEILNSLFLNVPTMLKSNDKIDLEFVLNHKSLDDLVAALVEKKVMDLSFRGMREVARFFEDRLKMPLFNKEEDLKAVILAVEIRNLFTHNRGIVNRAFKSRAPWFECELDTYVNVVTDHLYSQHAALLIRSGEELGARVEEKFTRHTQAEHP